MLIKSRSNNKIIIIITEILNKIKNKINLKTNIKINILKILVEQ
jgi:hypothetical protein